MKAVLASSLGGSLYEDGKWIPAKLLSENGLLKVIKDNIKENAGVLIITAAPDVFEMSESFLRCFKGAFQLSGINLKSIEICDRRNMEITEHLNNYDAILLAGGHVPTQNIFFRELQLKEKLTKYNGFIMALSAGTMNCAETVYAMPECDGEGMDTTFKHFMKGLGITDIMVIPHFQAIKNDILDGMRVIEDIAFPDSMGRTFICLYDGSYLLIDDNCVTLHGKAMKIENGILSKLCENGDTITLSSGKN